MSSNFDGNVNNFQIQDYIFPEDPEEERLWIRYYLNNLSSAVNSKDSGLYDSVITVTGGQFYPIFTNPLSPDYTSSASSVNYRSILRIVVDTGALPNAGTKSVAHGIATTENFTFTRIYGCATDPGASTITEAIPLPYASPTAADNIELNIDATNINIITGSDRTNFTTSFVVIEYVTTL